MIRSTQVDRVLLQDYLSQSPEAKDWVAAASGQVPWFALELLEDFFFCFYLAKRKQTREAKRTRFTAGWSERCASSISTAPSIPARRDS